MSISTRTSTPYHEIETTDSDSGYHSYLSSHCASVDSSLPAERFKSLPWQTPESVDSLLDNGSIKSIECRKNEIVHTPISGKYIRTTFLKENYIDFLVYLGEKKNCTLIVKKILEYLNDEDLYSAANVSRSWKRIIMFIPTQRRKYRHYLRKRELEKENWRVGNVSNCGEDKVVVERRSTLTEIQNNISNPLSNSNSPRTPSSPAVARVSGRIEKFQAEGKRLKTGKRQYVCPRCKLPAHSDENEIQTAVCTGSECSYRFCILCHCVAHPSKLCNFISTPVVRKQADLIGTRTNKKNLKRLLL